LAALAEKKISLRIDDENILYMYSDVGAGIIAKNDLFWGSSWSAGELQLNFKDSGDLNFPSWVEKSHYFTSRGVDLGIIEDAKLLLGDGNVDTHLKKLTDGDPDNVTFSAVFEAVKMGDKACTDLVDRTLSVMGLKVAYLTNFLNPEVVVIGGGLDRGGDYVVNYVRRVVKKIVMEEVAGSVKIILSRLGEDAVALGAVSLVTQELFSEV
jgi:predicted NBD/HSP70 family sugar kinase